MNREQRRHPERFPQHDEAEAEGEAKENPAYGSGDDGQAYAGRPDQDVTRLTGAGTGGATESDGRVPNHEGVHLGNQPNS
jgi:hypothetical protein